MASSGTRTQRRVFCDSNTILIFFFKIAIRFIADDTGAFTSSVGLLFDASPLLGYPRSKVRVGVVRIHHIDLMLTRSIFLALRYRH